MFGPHVKYQDPYTPPFYVTLVIHDLLLHNCMLDSEASYNFINLYVMDQLGLHITNPYKELYSFDYKRAKFFGMIKDLVVYLVQIIVKGVVTDNVVVDIPARFDMFLSISWGMKLG